MSGVSLAYASFPSTQPLIDSVARRISSGMVCFNCSIAPRVRVGGSHFPVRVSSASSPSRLSPAITAQRHPIVVLPAKRITGWQPFIDYPHPPDHDDLGVTYDYDFTAKPMKTSIRSREPNFSADAIVDEELAEKVSIAQAGDKLAGWPLWVQGPEYPDCPTYSTLMRLLFQLDSSPVYGRLVMGWPGRTACLPRPVVICSE